MIILKLESGSGALLYEVALMQESTQILEINGHGQLRIFGVEPYLDLKDSVVLLRVERTGWNR